MAFNPPLGSTNADVFMGNVQRLDELVTLDNLVCCHCALTPVIRSQKYVSATEPIVPLIPAVARIM